MTASGGLLRQARKKVTLHPVTGPEKPVSQNHRLWVTKTFYSGNVKEKLARHHGIVWISILLSSSRLSSRAVPTRGGEEEEKL